MIFVVFSFDVLYTCLTQPYFRSYVVKGVILGRGVLHTERGFWLFSKLRSETFLNCGKNSAWCNTLRSSCKVHDIFGPILTKTGIFFVYFNKNLYCEIPRKISAIASRIVSWGRTDTDMTIFATLRTRPPPKKNEHMFLRVIDNLHWSWAVYVTKQNWFILRREAVIHTRLVTLWPHFP